VAAITRLSRRAALSFLFEGIRPAPQRKVVMKAIYWTIAAAALTFVQAAPSSAGQSDPETIIYRFPGVVDKQGVGAGEATVFHCTNFSGVSENIRIVIRIDDGQLVANQLYPINHLATLTATTHNINSFTFGSARFLLGSNGATIPPGTAAIAATSINIICTAMIVDGAPSTPVGVALRGIRFAPVSGSQE